MLCIIWPQQGKTYISTNIRHVMSTVSAGNKCIFVLDIHAAIHLSDLVQVLIAYHANTAYVH